MVSGEALKKLQEQIMAWPMTQRFVVQQLIEDYRRDREDLRAYEDTRLTPEETKRMSNILMDVGIDYNCSWEYVKNWLLDARLRELAEADKNGRVMIAPCKVGDTAYWVHNRTVTVCRVYRIQMNRKGTFICLKSNKSHGEFRADICLGKTIFFSSEEAEKAMEVSE